MATAAPALQAYADRAAGEPAAAPSFGGDATSSLTAPLVGKKVVISGLLARPDLNGKRGLAASFNAATGRYTVELEGTAAEGVLALKSSNLSAAAAAASSSDATLFGAGARVRLKSLASSPELNECGATIVEWNSEKERYVIELDGSLKRMLLRASNLERDRRERWVPDMPNAANLAHIQRERDRYVEEQAAQNANPFAAMDPTGEMFAEHEARREQREAEAAQ